MACPSVDTTRHVTVYVPPGRPARTRTSRPPLAFDSLPESTRFPSTSKTLTAPKATSTGSENWSRTAAGGVLTVVWGEGSLRNNTAWATAGPAADTTMASTITVLARARVRPERSGGRTAEIVAAGPPAGSSGPRQRPPGGESRRPETDEDGAESGQGQRVGTRPGQHRDGHGRQRQVGSGRRFHRAVRRWALRRRFGALQ